MLFLGALPSFTSAQTSVSTGLEQAFNNTRYGIESRGSSLLASNAANHFSVRFSAAQTTIVTGQGTEATLTLDEYGWGSSLRPAGSVSHVTYSGKRLDRLYSPGLKEWFENSSEGLEQGFILAHRDELAAGPLHIRLSTTASWRAEKSGNGVQLTLGSTILQYTGLKAWDANGTLLTSRLRARENQIEIEVDDTRAVYPLTIDPAFVQQATLTAADAGDNYQFGGSVSLSADGNTAIIGSVGNNSFTGAAYIFTRSSAGVWTQQAEFTAFDGVADDYFGTAVALSGDGNTAIVGAKTIDPSVVPVGAVYVFTRSGTTWTFQSELVSPDSAPNDLFGASISLSNDGATALIGAPGSNLNLGAAYVFTGSGANWIPQATLATVGATTNDGFGGTVSLSSDGNTALVGASNKGHGIADVFTRSGTSWAVQQELTASDETAQYSFGTAVALSGDGNTALIGSPPNSNIPQSGVAYAFIRSGAAWSQQQKLIDPSPSSFSTFGSSLVLSGDGNTALLGTWTIGFTKNLTNIADVYGRSGTTWTLHQQVTNTAALNDGYYYGSTALSSDAGTALLGLSNRNSDAGVAYALQFNAAASAGPPTVVSVAPNSGSAASQKFTAVYEDLNGASNLASVRILFNATPTGPNSCYVSYFPPSNQLYLANDANTALYGPVIPGSSGQVSNSQCTLSGAGSSYSTSGINATLNVAIAFTHTPPENIYLLDNETDGTNSGWIQEGVWGATLGVPVPVSLSPGSGSGRSQIFTAVYSDPNGGRDLANLHLLFNSKLSVINGCSVLYSRSANVFYLSNDPGDVLSAPVIPGSTTQVSNTQCTLSGIGSSYSVSGNDVTLQVALAFNSSIPQQKWTASDAAQSDYFGSAVSLSSDGNTALVGSGRNDFTGAAYIFTHSATGWTQQKELTIPNAVAGDFFGYSAVLSSDGNTALVGASGDIDTTGAAYVFTRSGVTWTQQQQLTAPQPAAGDQFGYALALSSDGNTALVGTAGFANGQGTVYVFTRSGVVWTQQRQLTPSDATSTDFGVSVALSSDGNTALVGAGYNNVSYVFTRSGATWTQQARLSASDTSIYFGAAVALSAGGNNALVGDTGSNGNTGAAYLFTRSGSTWVQQRKFTAPDTAANSYFGSTVALANAGSTALIGTASGNAAYLFTRSGTTWAEQNELIAADANGKCCHAFGAAVALSSTGVTALVGDVNGIGIGSAYWFNLAAGFIPLPAQKIYVLATENNGSTSGWLQEGTWTPTQ